MPTARISITSWISMKSMILHGAAGRLIAIGMPLLTIFMLGCPPTVGQSLRRLSGDTLQREFDNGHFRVVIENVRTSTVESSLRPSAEISPEELLLVAKAQISLERYDDASNSLEQAIIRARKTLGTAKRTSAIYFAYSMLFRAKREFRRAFEYAKAGLGVSPNDRQVRCEYYLNVGKILFSFGYDLSAVIWLEKAEMLVEPGLDLSICLDLYRFQSLAWESKFNFAKAEAYAEKLVSLAEKTRFQYRYRVGLLELANLKSASGQKRSAVELLDKGAKLSVAADDRYLGLNFLSTLMLNAIYDKEMYSANGYLRRLEQIDIDKTFVFETSLGRAVIAAFQGQKSISEQYFAKASRLEHRSSQIIPYWKATIATKDRDWNELLLQSIELQKQVEKENFREDLPGIYLNFAKAYSGLGRLGEAREYAQKTIAIVDEIRPVGEASLSLGLAETYQEAYRLLAELRIGDPDVSFASSDYVKARVLRDRIDNSILRPIGNMPSDLRAKIDGLAERFIESGGGDPKLGDEIERLERSLTTKIPSDNSTLPNFQNLNGISSLSGVAIVSYFFTIDGKLLAYVWENNSPVRVVTLSPTEDEVSKLAVDTQWKIRNFVYFKKDAKEIYNKLLGPLSLKANHLIVIPDKALWKIPFHALSADGETYLIESTMVNYAPSVETLLDAVGQPTPKRMVMQAFANNSYKGRFLSHVNREADTVASIFGTRSAIDATSSDFLMRAGASDIVHFSMHAELDAERPLQSFLAFKPTPGNSGKLTVADILRLHLKKQSLVFLASCDTNTIVDGEGVVSLAWAMLGSGATSVVSSQWEADDQASEKFSSKFYTAYSTGTSVAGSMQSAAIGMIREKSAGLHEPYYWAAFALYGDYR